MGKKLDRGPFPFSLFASLPFPFSLSGVVLGLDLPKRGFGPDSDPHGSKSGSEGIPWQLFSSRISWQAPNPPIVSKMDRNIKGFGSGFSDFSDFPKMENRGHGWTGLGLGSPKTVFSAQKPCFLSHFGHFPLFGGFPWVPYWALLAPIGPRGAGGSGEAFRLRFLC